EKAILPCQFRVLPGFVFRNSRPAVVGVKIIEGRLKTNAEVMNEKGEVLGRVLNIQEDKETVTEAKREQEVAVSISDAVMGRNLSEGDVLYTKITLGMQNLLKKVNLSEDEKELLQKILDLQSTPDTQTSREE
ncbi:MAG: translation initiation factor IF-2, partial [archaeon]